ncbi:MAG TPA: phenylacetate--CoA ligase [Dehalococcoidia bacterium]|nr:phenylacetate--CoA ligase [Dehalococcoidia bacterium]
MALRGKESFIYDESKERMPKEEREKWLDQRLADIVEYAYKNVPPVKDKFDKAGVPPSEIHSIQDLEKVPVTTKDELVRLQRANPPFGGFLTVPINKLSRVYISPGPIYDVGELDRSSAFARHFKAAGFAEPGDIVINTGSYHMVPFGLLITDALDLLGVTVIPAGVGQTELQVQIMHDLKVTGYFGFPSFLMSIIKKAEEMGYNFRRDFSLRWALGTGERHIQMLRGIFEKDYGIEISQMYGTADVGMLAYECTEKNGMHYNDEDAIIEIVNPDTGKQCSPLEEGEVVVTLLNKIYPLIRFATGDLSSYTHEPCPCGRTTPRLTAITGMIGDHVRAKGMFIHARELDEAMSTFAEVSKYQMVLSLSGHKDTIGLKLEAKQSVDQQTLSNTIRKRCKEVFRLTVDDINFVPEGTLPEPHKKFVDERWK